MLERGRRRGGQEGPQTVEVEVEVEVQAVGSGMVDGWKQLNECCCVPV